MDISNKVISIKISDQFFFNVLNILAGNKIKNLSDLITNHIALENTLKNVFTKILPILFNKVSFIQSVITLLLSYYLFLQSLLWKKSSLV